MAIHIGGHSHQQVLWVLRIHLSLYFELGSTNNQRLAIRQKQVGRTIRHVHAGSLHLLGQFKNQFVPAVHQIIGRTAIGCLVQCRYDLIVQGGYLRCGIVQLLHGVTNLQVGGTAQFIHHRVQTIETGTQGFSRRQIVLACSQIGRVGRECLCCTEEDAQCAGKTRGIVGDHRIYARNLLGLGIVKSSI